MLRAPQRLSTQTTYAGSDSFTSTTVGNVLNARVAPLGGTWATSGSAAGDFLFADAGAVLTEEAIKRNVKDTTGPRFAILGSTNYTSIYVSMAQYIEGLTAPPNEQSTSGVMARYVDGSNYLFAGVMREWIAPGSTLVEYFGIWQVVAGVSTRLAYAPHTTTDGHSIGGWTYESTSARQECSLHSLWL